MKNILLISLIMFAFSATAQIEYYPIKAGQYAIYNSGSTGDVTIEYQSPTSGNIAYRNRIDVVDTIMQVLSLTSLDTLSTFTRPSGKILGISFPDSAKYTDVITLSDDSIICFTKKTAGNNAIFDGADVITGLSSDLIEDDYTLTFTAEVGSSSFYNYRQVVPSGQIGGSQIRIKVEAGTTFDTNVDNASIGLRSGTSDDFAEAPTRITFGGEDTILVVAGTTTWSDWIDIDINGSNDYLIHTYVNTGTKGYRYGTSGNSYRSTSSTDNTFTETIDYGSELTGTRIWSSIESKYTVWEKTGITTQPYIMYLNGNLGESKESIAACTSEGDWFWDSGTDVISIYTTGGDPSGNIELGQRGKLIDVNSRNNITLKNLTLQHSNDDPSSGIVSGAMILNTGSNLTVSGCEFLDNAKSGLYCYNSSYVTVDDNTFLRNGITDNKGHNFKFYTTLADITDVTFSNNICSYAGWNGLIVYTVDATKRISNVDIHGNTFNYNKAAGAYTIKCDSVAVYDNTFDYNGDEIAVGEDYAFGSQGCSYLDFYNNIVTNQVYNDAVQFWADNSESGHNIRIFRNYIDGVGTGDCIGLNFYDNETATNVEIFYNVLVNADYRGIGMYREGTGVSSSVSIYNNTFHGNLVGDIGTVLDFPMDIKNNIFNSNVVNVIATGLLSGLVTSNNLWYRASGNVLDYGGTTYTSATITNFEASAQTTDPLFTDAANEDFTLQTGSPAIKTGVDVGLTEDILGNPIVNPPDMGAYEKQ